jgi:hypothetical protein
MVASGAVASSRPSVIRFDQLLGRALQSLGIDAVYGHAFGRLPVVAVADTDVAEILAQAHRRVHRAPAAVLGDDGVVALDPPGRSGERRSAAVDGDRVSAVDPDAASTIDVGSADDLLEAVAALSMYPAAPRRWRLGVEPGRPAPDALPPTFASPSRWEAIGDDVVDAVRGARRVAVLVGPGVVSAGVGPELHELAALGGLGVVNTWGAKGVFDWRSRHHGATVGLQEHDFTLGGLGDADLILASGVDHREAPPDRWQLAPWIEVAPSTVGPLAERWPSAPGAPEVRALRTRLATVTQRAWEMTTAPLLPTRVTLHYAQVLGRDGMVAADPGRSGFWVARTFATTEVGQVHVPAERDRHGFGAACALVARLRRPGRPVLAVADAPLDPGVSAVMEAASSLGVAVALEVWDSEGVSLDADEHVERLRRLVVADDPAVSSLATDGSQLDDMVEAAGAIVAWTS